MTTISRTADFVPRFAELWANPSRDKVLPLVDDDVTGHWPGSAEPTRGADAYADRIAQVLELLPDLTLTVTAHAAHEDTVFISWHGTARDGQLELEGIDRIRLRNGRVIDNLIRFDPTVLLNAQA